MLEHQPSCFDHRRLGSDGQHLRAQHFRRRDLVEQLAQLEATERGRTRSKGAAYIAQADAAYDLRPLDYRQTSNTVLADRSRFVGQRTG